jgi:hypothetical protein
MRALERGAKVAVSGVVVDSETGEPVSGVEVLGLPRGKDFPWEPAAPTDARGKFTLELAAPARYSFVLRRLGVSIVTPLPADPAYRDVETRPGVSIDGIRLVFDRKSFEKALAGTWPP